jgi:hypothetical protein
MKLGIVSAHSGRVSTVGYLARSARAAIFFASAAAVGCSGAPDQGGEAAGAEGSAATIGPIGWHPSPCPPGYVGSSPFCMLDTTKYPSDISDYLFGSNVIAGPLSNFSVSINNNVMTFNVPQGYGFPTPPPTTLTGLSGSKSGVNYDANVENLTFGNFQWSKNGPIYLSAALNGTIQVNMNWNGMFGCTTYATITNAPVNAMFELADGQTNVPQPGVNMNSGNTSWNGFCTYASVIGSDGMTSIVASAIQSQLWSELQSLAVNNGTSVWSSLMTVVANDGLVTCNQGCSAATLPPPSPGWSWQCTALDTAWGMLTGTCQRH